MSRLALDVHDALRWLRRPDRKLASAGASRAVVVPVRLSAPERKVRPRLSRPALLPRRRLEPEPGDR